MLAPRADSSYHRLLARQTRIARGRSRATISRRRKVAGSWPAGCGGIGVRLGDAGRALVCCAREGGLRKGEVPRQQGPISGERRMPNRRWSQRVSQRSNALDLDAGVFTRADPRSIARSLKRSADCSRRRKADPFRSAISMLTFYINRAGKSLSAAQRRRLEAAKDELRRPNRRPPRSRPTRRSARKKKKAGR